MQATLFTPSDPAGAARESQLSMVPHLQRSAVFRDFQSAFEITTGLPLTVRAAGSFQPPLHGSKRANPFCALMARMNKTCAACLQLQQQIEDRAICGPKTLECFAGLNDSAVPIRVGENILGYLQTGQVLLREPSKARFGHAVRELKELEAESDLRKVEALYFRTRVVPRRKYESVLHLLTIFAQQLSVLSNQLMVREAAAVSPQVARARDFIAEHFDEELSLGCVAEAVCMSPFYFCKVFRRETGVSFTDYLARLRIEKVKHLLLNPHLRVSEAAFAAGFQSLSQFNRVFRRIAGEAPSSYRDRLHGSRESAIRSHPLVHAA